MCFECEISKAKNHDLSKALQNFTNSKSKLNDMLENQQNFQNRKGLGFGKSKRNKKRTNKSYRPT